MASPHKLMWTGIDIETSLDPEQVQHAVTQAFVGVKGKFTLAADSPLAKTYAIKGSETFFSTAPELTFDVQISDEVAGRRAVRMHIVRALLQDGSLLFGPKKMLGHKAYMKIVQAFGARVAQVDPSARVTLREGPKPEAFALDSLTQRVPAPRSAG